MYNRHLRFTGAQMCSTKKYELLDAIMFDALYGIIVPLHYLLLVTKLYTLSLTDTLTNNIFSTSNSLITFFVDTNM